MKRLIGLLILAGIIMQPVFAGHGPGTLGKIKKTNSITIAYTDGALPFSFTEQGKPRGYSIEICLEVINDLKETLGLDELKVRWLPGNTPESLQRVASGEADMDCGTTSITLARQEKVDFSNEIFVDSAGVLVLGKSNIKGLVSLGNKKVAVIPGTTTEKRLVKALKRKLISAKLVHVHSGDDGFAALTAGTVDAYAGDRITLAGKVSQSKDPSIYEAIPEEFSVDPYGLVLPRGDADFRLAVNRSLAKVFRDGAIEQIFNKWFVDAEPSELLWAVYILNAYPD